MTLIVDKLFENEYGTFTIDPETGALYWISDDIDPEDTDNVLVTEGGAEYSIFPDDEEDDLIHIEIQPDFVWDKEDVWELVDRLLFAIGEIDADGNLIGEHSPKPLFEINVPATTIITEEQAKAIAEAAKSALTKANIDAVPLILSDGIWTRFNQP